MVSMKPMSLWRHAFAYVTLGLLCGWYYFLMLFFPFLIICIVRGSYVAATVLVFFVTLSIIPLKHKHWDGFMYSFVFDIWKEYFDYTTDWSTLTKHNKEGNKYIFFEFPHGIFPMGQFISCCFIKEITPGKMICGTGADIIFMFPIMRHIMAWVGTVPAKRANITKVFKEGKHCAVIPGGIAEMYLMSEDSEGIYLRKRHNTVKAAIQEGAHIVPSFFFGNTKIFNVASGSGSDSWMSKLSRKLRASIVIFFGRQGLPVPLRHPIRMVTGNIVEVVQCDAPSEEQIQETMDRVIASVEDLYQNKKPDWETRPLIIL